MSGDDAALQRYLEFKRVLAATADDEQVASSSSSSNSGNSGLFARSTCKRLRMVCDHLAEEEVRVRDNDSNGAGADGSGGAGSADEDNNTEEPHHQQQQQQQRHNHCQHHHHHHHHRTTTSIWQLSSLLSLVRAHLAPSSGYCYDESSAQQWDVMLSTIFKNCIMRNAMNHSWERILSNLMVSDLALGSNWREAGVVAKLYTIVFPLLIECSVNDDSLGIKRIDAQYDIGCSIINFRDELGWSLLHHAASNKSLRVITYLYENHFSVNERSAEGGDLTPLHMAAFRQFHEVVELLLDCGAVRSITSSRGETALDLLLSSVSISANRNSTSSPQRLFQTIYFLLPSVDDLWRPSSSSWPSSSSSSSIHGSLFHRICSVCDSSVVEEVATLAMQADSSSWCIECLVHCIVTTVRNQNISCATMLVQKFRAYLSRVSKLPDTFEYLSLLLSEIIHSQSTQLLALICAVLNISRRSESLGFLSSRQLGYHMNMSVLRGDLLMCKYIVENFVYENDYIYSWFDEEGCDENIISYYSSTFVDRVSSLSPMMLGIFSDDAAVTNLLMAFG